MAEAALDIVVRTREAVDNVVRLRTEMQGLGRESVQAEQKVGGSLASPNLLGRFRAVTGELGAMRAAFAASGVAAAGLGLVKIAREAIEAVKALDDLSDAAIRVGLSVEQLQEIQFAAAATGGLDVEGVNKALEHFARRIAEAARGGEEAQRVFAQLGVSVQLANGRIRDTDAVFDDVAAAFAKVKDPSEQLRIATELLSARYVKLADAWRGGREELDELRAVAQRSGIATNELAEEAGELEKRWNRATAELKGSVAEIVNVREALVALAEPIVRATELFAGMARAAADAFDKAAGGEFAGVSDRDLLGQVGGLEFERKQLVGAFGITDPKRVAQILEEERRIQAEIGRRSITQEGGFRPDLEPGARGDAGSGEGALAPPPAVDTGTGELKRVRDDAFDAVIGSAEFQREAELLGEIIREQTTLWEAYGEELKAIANLERAGALTAEEAALARKDALEETVDAELEAITSSADYQRSLSDVKQILDEIQAPAEAYREELERINEAERQGALTAEQAARARQKAKDDLEKDSEQARDIERTLQELSGGIQQTITDLITGSKDAGDAFKEMGARIVAALLEIIIQATVLKPLLEELGGSLGGLGGGGGGGGIGGFFKSFGLNFVSNLFGGFRFAEGGIVTRPTLALIGEGGESEAVIPLSRAREFGFGGASGAGDAGPRQVSVQIVNQGAPLAVESVTSQPTVSGEEFVIRVVQDQLERGGPLASSIGRRFLALPPKSQV